MNSGGWTTAIGDVTGARAWNDIREIVEASGTIAIVGENENALVIPTRAFNTEEALERLRAPTAERGSKSPASAPDECAGSKQRTG